ncbi:hypothetical protein ACP3TC_07575 [Winslowiella sp. 2C04]|uniref:hypothetical protein n=1 Tax=Winslowiella sp. 2C04 TaxID=3416179 RepID=UPI003CE71428
MINVKILKVVKRETHPTSHRIVYLLESGCGRWFTCSIAPDDIVLTEGNILKHEIGVRWITDAGDKINISPSHFLSSKEEAETRFSELMS